MKKLLLIKFSIIFCIFFSACQSSMKTPSTLIELPNAIDPSYQQSDDGIFQLTYKLKAQYPAKDIIYKISKQLGTNGWQQLSRDYFNSSLTSSHVQGCTNFIATKNNPHQKVYQWRAQWDDTKDTIVGYEFTYNYPKDKTPDLSELKIRAYHIPAALVAKKELKSPPRLTQE